MSCGPAAGLKKLADKVDGLNNEIDSLVSSIQSGAIGGIKSVVDDATSQVKDAVKGMIPEIDLPKVPDSLQNDVTKIAKTLITGKLAADQIQNELNNLKGKWGNVDFGDIDLNNLPNLLRNGALDIENICKLIPNFEKEGADVIVKGLPITFPEIDAVNIIRGGTIPEVPEPKVTIDVARAKREAGEKFINVVKPRFGG